MLRTPVHAVRRTTAVIVCALLALLSTLLPGGAAARAETSALAARVGFSNGGGFPWLSDAELARELDLMASTGARWVRVDFDWSGVEHVRGRYDWRNLDRVVAAAHRRGIQVLALPAYTPSWARPAGTSSHTPPTDPAGFAAFVAAAAARYVPLGVTTYEIWNEPNIPNFWEPKPDVVAYATLLKATTAAVRAAAPGARIVTAGLSPASDTADGRYVDPRTFLERLYELGAGDSFDAVGIHPYSFPALPSDASTASWNTFQKMTQMRQTMTAYGDADKKIWLTETGAPTGGDGAVSLTRQADIVTDTLKAVSGLSWAGPVFFYAARDGGTDPTDREDNFGLLRRDFTPKPAWTALVSGLTAPAAPAVVTPPTTVVEPVVQPVAAPVVAAPAPAPAPAAPAGVRAWSVRGGAAVAWHGVAGATSYVVERSATAPGSAGRSWARVATPDGAARSLADRSVTAGTRYWYRVRAASTAGTGAASAEVSAVAGAVVRSRLLTADGKPRRVFGPRVPVAVAR